MGPCSPKARSLKWQQQPEALTRAFSTPRHADSYIMDTFPIEKGKVEDNHGHYRAKETILQIQEALTESVHTGQPDPSKLPSKLPKQITR